MKYKLLAIVVIALLLCAAVPMMATAAPTPKPPRDVRMTLSTNPPAHGKPKVVTGATFTVPTGTTTFTLTASQSGHWKVNYPSGLGWVPPDPSTSIAIETTNEPGSYFVTFSPTDTAYALWSATIVVPPTPAPPPV